MNNLRRLACESAAKEEVFAKLPVIMADMLTGEIVLVNKSAADLFGYEVDELRGQKIEVLVPEGIRFAHSKWRQDAVAPHTRLMGSGRQVGGVRKDGSAFNCHVGLQTVTALGRNVGVAFIVDLTSLASGDRPGKMLGLKNQIEEVGLAIGEVPAKTAEKVVQKLEEKGGA